MLFTINCTSISSANDEISEVSLRGVLQDTTILIQTEEMYYGAISPEARNECYVKRILSGVCIERKVPLNIWPVMEEILSSYARGSLGASAKEHFCSINEFKFEPGVPFEAGSKVEIITASENDCQRVVLMRPGNPPLKLPTSLIKIKVLDGKDKGLEGWTWTGAVSRE